MKSATRGAASASGFGESRATCSISSLKLTAPALHLNGENLANDSSQQALEARVFQISQTTHGLFLVGIEKAAAAIGDGQLIEQFSQMPGIAVGRLAPPELLNQLKILAFGALSRERQWQRGPKRCDVAAVRFFGQILDVVANLIGDAEGLGIFAENFREVLIIVLAGVGSAEAQGDFERGGGFLAENIQHLKRRKLLGIAHPAKLRPLAEAEGAMAGGGDFEHGRARFSIDIAFADEAIAFAEQ